MERGRRLGIDVGSVRIGVALCDPDGLLAMPLVTLPASGAVDSLVELISEYEIVEIVIGLPKHLKGTSGQAVSAVEEFAARLKKSTTVPISFIDERMTTSAASKQLSSVGKRAKDQKQIIDQVAAAGILQLFLDRERSR